MSKTTIVVKHEVDHARSPARDSALSFAVVWDPESGGLQAYSAPKVLEDEGDNSLSKTPNPHRCSKIEVDVKASLPPAPHEPFAVFGGRQTHFLDIRSSSVYERCIRGQVADVSSVHSNSDSVSSYTQSSCTHDTHTLFIASPRPSSRTEVSSSSQIAHEYHKANLKSTSTFTFTSFCEYTGLRKGKGAGSEETVTIKEKPRPSTPIADRYSTVPRSASLHAIQPKIEKPTPVSRTPKHNRSSSLDPALHSLRVRHAISTYDSTACPPAGTHTPTPTQNQNTSRRTTKSAEEKEIIDDEGFFELSSHFECEPHLPSRFSTTTTSTSTYIDIGADEVLSAEVESGPYPHPTLRPRPMTHVQRAISRHIKSASETCFDAPRRRTLSDARADSVARLSKAISMPWRKRTTDNRWVLVDVQSIIVERIIDIDD